MAKGRPREFNIDDALERALQVFWRTGFEGASITELTEAMGVNKPSLYATFGNKAELYAKVLDRYSDGPASYFVKSLEETTIHAVLERLLYGCADSVTLEHYPRGCLGVNGALACSQDSEPIKHDLTARRKANESLLRARLLRALEAGDWRWDATPASIASYVMTISYGIAVQGADGATREELYEVVRTALSSLLR